MGAFDDAYEKKSLSLALNNVLKRSVDRSRINYTPGIVAGVTTDKETVYLEAAGVTNIETKEPIQKDTLFYYWSNTKAIVCTALLILVEKRKVDLDVPAKKYLPRLGEVKVLKEIKDGNLYLEDPKNDITLRMLLTHTAGFSYSFARSPYSLMYAKTGQPDLLNINDETFDCQFLIFEPGTNYSYGTNIDWVGLIIEKVTGQTLESFLTETIFDPLGMHCTFRPLKFQKDKLMALHYRNPEGKVLIYHRKFYLKYDIGGHGLVGTVEDYLKFMRLWLNKGKTSYGVALFSETTWEMAIANHLPDGIFVTSGGSSNPDLVFGALSDDKDFHGLVFAKTSKDSKSGKPKHTLYWSGIANLYYWIDLENRIASYWATELFPSGNPVVESYIEFEKAVYECI